MRGNTERGDVEHLRLAPLEEARAVGGGDDPHLSRQGPDVGQAATVHAHAFVGDARPWTLCLINDRTAALISCFAAFQGLGDLGDDGGGGLVRGRVALGLLLCTWR